MGQDF